MSSFWPLAAARSSHESLFFLHTLEHFFTLFHSLSLQEFHLNTGLLIAEIQANLAQNKANKMVDKIQSYKQEQALQIMKSYISNQNYIPIEIQATTNINENHSQPDYHSPQNKNGMQLR